MGNQSENLLLALAGAVGVGLLAFFGKKSSDKNGTSFMEGVSNVVDDGLKKFAGEYQETREKAIKNVERELKQKSSEQLQYAYEKNRGNQMAEDLIGKELNNRGIKNN